MIISLTKVELLVGPSMIIPYNHLIPLNMPTDHLRRTNIQAFLLIFIRHNDIFDERTWKILFRVLHKNRIDSEMHKCCYILINLIGVDFFFFCGFGLLVRGIDVLLFDRFFWMDYLAFIGEETITKTATHFLYIILMK